MAKKTKEERAQAKKEKFLTSCTEAMRVYSAQKNVRPLLKLIGDKKNNPFLNLKVGSKDTILGNAVKAGSAEVVVKLLGTGVDIGIDNEGGDKSTPLHRALLNGNVEIAKLLINGGADLKTKINVPLDGGGTVSDWTPLQIAAQLGNLEIVELLINRGDELTLNDTFMITLPDKSFTTENTALTEAVIQGHAGIVKLLLGKGAEVTDAVSAAATALGDGSPEKVAINGLISVVNAVSDNDFARAVELLTSEVWTTRVDNGFFALRLLAAIPPIPEYSYDTHKPLSYTHAALQKAVSKSLSKAVTDKNVEVVTSLIEKGAEVSKDQRDLVAKFSDSDPEGSIKSLITRPAAVAPSAVAPPATTNATAAPAAAPPAASGAAPSVNAAGAPSAIAEEIVIPKKSKVEKAQEAKFLTSCAEAINGDDEESLLRLVRDGQNKDFLGLKAGGGLSILDYAVLNDQSEIVELLVLKVVDNSIDIGINKVGKDGFMPLHRAVLNKNEKIAKLLFTGGAELKSKIEVNLDDGTTVNDWTPLQIAAQSGDLDIVELLINKGAGHTLNDTFTMKDKQGNTTTENTALTEAIRLGHGNIVDSLLAKSAAPAFQKFHIPVATSVDQTRCAQIESAKEGLVARINEIADSADSADGKIRIAMDFDRTATKADVHTDPVFTAIMRALQKTFRGELMNVTHENMGACLYKALDPGALKLLEEKVLDRLEGVTDTDSVKICDAFKDNLKGELKDAREFEKTQGLSNFGFRDKTDEEGNTLSDPFAEDGAITFMQAMQIGFDDFVDGSPSSAENNSRITNIKGYGEPLGPESLLVTSFQNSLSKLTALKTNDKMEVFAASHTCAAAVVRLALPDVKVLKGACNRLGLSNSKDIKNKNEQLACIQNHESGSQSQRLIIIDDDKNVLKNTVVSEVKAAVETIQTFDDKLSGAVFKPGSSDAKTLLASKEWSAREDKGVFALQLLTDIADNKDPNVKPSEETKALLKGVVSESLSNAVENNNVEAVKSLIRYGAEVTQEQLTELGTQGLEGDMKDLITTAAAVTATATGAAPPATASAAPPAATAPVKLNWETIIKNDASSSLLGSNKGMKKYLIVADKDIRAAQRYVGQDPVLSNSFKVKTLIGRSWQQSSKEYKTFVKSKAESIDGDERKADWGDGLGYSNKSVKAYNFSSGDGTAIATASTAGGVLGGALRILNMQKDSPRNLNVKFPQRITADDKAEQINAAFRAAKMHCLQMNKKEGSVDATVNLIIDGIGIEVNAESTYGEYSANLAEKQEDQQVETVISDEANPIDTPVNNTTAVVDNNNQTEILDFGTQVTDGVEAAKKDETKKSPSSTLVLEDDSSSRGNDLTV